VENMAVAYDESDVATGISFNVTCYNRVSEQSFFQLVDLYAIIYELNLNINKQDVVEVAVVLNTTHTRHSQCSLRVCLQITLQ
jgi:hypothetical protein